jgi:putative membrane protein
MVHEVNVLGVCRRWCKRFSKDVSERTIGRADCSILRDAKLRLALQDEALDGCARLPGRKPAMSQRPPRPRAFRLDDRRVAVDDQPAPFAPAAIIQSQHEPIPAAVAPAPIDEAELEVEAAQRSGLIARSRFTLAGLAWTGLCGLVSLALGLWATSLIEGLFARAESLGVIGLIFGFVFLVGLIGVAAREMVAVARQTRIAEMHVAFAKARAADDRAQARRLVGQLVALYRSRPETARARAQVEETARAIIDGRDLIDIAERALLRPLDEKAQGAIADAAKRVSLVTAISPRAILDVVFVVAQIVRLVRRIAEIYGGRPGLFGLIKLARSIGAHIAITGGMAVGDSVLQQLVGHGIASRISARMGEGVLNGLLTARVGLSALAVCRPAPFSVDKAPGVSDVAPFLFSKGE